MRLHQNSRAFQVLRGQAVRFVTRPGQSEFAVAPRRAMAYAIDAGVMVVGTNDHKRFHMPRRIPLERIKSAQREWGYGMGHGIYRCPDLGVRFFTAYECSMAEAGGRYEDPSAVILVSPGHLLMRNVPDHGDCSLAHYFFDEATETLAELSYVRPRSPFGEDDPAPWSCRTALGAMIGAVPGQITDDERRILRSEGRGAYLNSTDGVIIVQGLSDAERRLVVAHDEECRRALSSLTDPGSAVSDRLSQYRSASVVGFGLGEDVTRRFYLEHRLSYLELREAQQNAREYRFFDVGGR